MGSGPRCFWGVMYSGLRTKVKVSMVNFVFVFFGSFRVRDGVRVRFWLGPGTRLLHCVYMGEQSVSLLAKLR